MLKIDRRKALINNLNTRAENHGEEHVPGADIGIKFNCSGKKYFPMFMAGATATSIEAFWNKDGSIRFPGLGPLRVKGNIEGVDVNLTEELPDNRVVTSLRDGAVKDIRLTPNNDFDMEVKLTYQCNPGDDDWKSLVRLMKEECFFQMTERQQSLDLSGKDEEKEDDEAA